jgi:hypothetical protein
MLASGHPIADRVVQWLKAAEVAIGNQQSPVFGGDAIGLELIIHWPAEPPSDATNHFGGVEMRSRQRTVEALSSTYSS